MRPFAQRADVPRVRAAWRPRDPILETSRPLTRVRAATSDRGLPHSSQPVTANPSAPNAAQIARPGDTATPALQIEGVSKRYGEQVALREVSLKVGAGERLSLLGPNGAGKTTLVRCVSGRVRPDCGRIRLRGEPLTHALRAEHLGLVPQEIALYPSLTARANLEIFGRLYGLRGADLARRVEWALEWVGLSARAKERIATYSGGMKRRINVACGVLHRPRVVLLDEPTAGVDPQSRERIYEMLDELGQQGTAFVMATHHLEEAEHRSDRVVILDGGRVIAQGTVPELVARTVGRRRRIVMRLDRPLDRQLPGMLQGTHPAEVIVETEDVVKDLPSTLATLEAVDRRIEDFGIEAPNLHAVFIHLTGRELRE
jgi:ABC-2 type transport system ATP-binding protein